MSNVFIVNSQTGNPTQPRLAWQNRADDCTLNTDQNSADIEYVRDGLTTMKWRPGTTTSYIALTNATINFDYVGLVGVNWQTAGASVSVTLNGTEIASASGLRDNQPFFVSVPQDIIFNVKFEFTCTETTLEVGEAYIGEAIEFERNVSVGYQPARWNDQSLITHSRTQANQFGRSTIEERGSEERFSIKFVSMAFMNSTFAAFKRDARGYPAFFLWDEGSQSHAVFGNWEVSNPTFESSLFSSINMTIKGVS